MSWWTTLWLTRADSWTYGPLTSPIPWQPVVADSAYITINLRAMRLANVRVGLSRVSGVVHAYTSAAHRDAGEATFHVVTTPSHLKEVDANKLDRVVDGTHTLLGPIPYRGGPIALEIGLFSIQISSFATPYLNLLQSVSSAVGVSYLSNAALPMARTLVEGVNSLGQADPQSLEIGISRTLTPPEVMTGCHFVMRAPRGSIDPASLGVDGLYRLVQRDGTPVPPYPYIVYTIEQAPKRDDWMRIPELLAAYKQLVDVARKGPEAKLHDALQVFATNVSWCADLLDGDATSLIAQVRAKVVGPKNFAAGGLALPPLESYAL